MPPKPKFTRKEVAFAALEIIKESGVEALTARALGNRLGTSASPIFTIFKNMNEVKWEARELALKEFEEYVGDFSEYTPAFLHIGMKMVLYAVNQPELFKLLFMQEHNREQRFENILGDLGSMPETCIKQICIDYDLSHEKAKILFEQMWVYTLGLGVLSAMKVCRFNEEEIAQKLGQVFLGMLTVAESKSIDKTFEIPVKELQH